MRSNLICAVKWAKSAHCTKIRSLHSEFAAFWNACSEASGSISTAVTLAAPRCAAMMATNPVPHPTSSTVFPHSIGNHAPSRTPSVPTFMEQRSCSIRKCLKSKYWLDMPQVSNFPAKLLFLFYSPLLTPQIADTCAQLSKFADYLQNDLCGPRNNLKKLSTSQIRLSQ